MCVLALLLPSAYQLFFKVAKLPHLWLLTQVFWHFHSNRPKEFVRGNNQLPDVNGTLAEVTEKLGKTSLKTPNDEEGDNDNSEEEEESDNDDDLFINTNRPPVVYYSSSEESSSEEEEEGEEDEHNLSIEGEDCSVDH